MVGRASRVHTALALVNSASCDCALLDVNLDGEIVLGCCHSLKDPWHSVCVYAGVRDRFSNTGVSAREEIDKKTSYINELEISILEMTRESVPNSESEI